VNDYTEMLFDVLTYSISTVYGSQYQFPHSLEQKNDLRVENVTVRCSFLRRSGRFDNKFLIANPLISDLKINRLAESTVNGSPIFIRENPRSHFR
jgi:hypothetical protein